ncbi:MAG TPA: hypothetical protein VHR84_08045 [Terriglobales bacterium]|jgi:hypothetical protein|nr:hypothetical protein [Terriglobales bacterium]
MAILYILGARQRKLIFKHEQEQNLYEAALILEVDTETRQVRTCVEYKSPLEACSGPNASMVFKSATMVGDILYSCTSTEVIIFKLPTFEKIGYITLPQFNDVHHVTPVSDGSLVVVSTGLDMVFKIGRDGAILEEWTVLEKPIWSRFSREVDYRKVETTKPHESHPNFAFELEKEIWATRFRQRDAICLTKPGGRIDIAVQTPHDGLIHGERIYFTTVDGRVVIVNRQTLKVQRVVDLNEPDNEKKVLLGWCRGLLPADQERMWVAFTRVRKTKFVENVLWVRSFVKDGVQDKPTHIALYDLEQQKRLDELDLEPYGMNIIFSIFPAMRSGSTTKTADTYDEKSSRVLRV